MFDLVLRLFVLGLAMIMTGGGGSRIHERLGVGYWLS